MIKIVAAFVLTCLVTLVIPTSSPGAADGASIAGPQTKAQKDAEKNKANVHKMICAAITALLQSAQTSFTDVKSSRDFDDSNDHWIAFESAITFPGARRCLVYTDRETGNETFVGCRMNVPPDKSAGDAFKKWYQEVIAEVTPCIPKTWAPHTDDHPHAEGYFFSMEESSPGPRIEIEPASVSATKQKELLINFFRR
ncbi:MAG TPA: hypothetical protein VI756_14820 [Blastocatellia bacterium]